MLNSAIEGICAQHFLSPVEAETPDMWLLTGGGTAIFELAGQDFSILDALTCGHRAQTSITGSRWGESAYTAVFGKWLSVGVAPRLHTLRVSGASAPLHLAARAAAQPWAALQRKIEEWCKLPNGWSGDLDSVAPTPAVASNVIIALHRLRQLGLPVPKAMIAPDGEIELSYALNDGFALLCFESAESVIAVVQHAGQSLAKLESPFNNVELPTKAEVALLQVKQNIRP